MRKSKKTLTLVAGLIATFALSACDGPTFSNAGHILTYTGTNGVEYHYSSGELFADYLNSANNVSTLFDSVYKVVVRNYFEVDAKGIESYPDIKKGADNDVAGVKSKAESAAEDNGTKYKDEFEKLLKSYNSEDEDELWEHFVYQRMTTEFEDQFYDANIEFIRDAKKEDAENKLKYSGYLEKMRPYHVRHILVKLGAQDKALYDARITESEAKKLADVGRSLAIGDETFGSLAKLYSEDTGSAEMFGDLGIMSKNTPFINEFKLGVYAYEGIYNTTLAVEAKDGLKITDKMETDYLNAVNNTDVGTIPYEAFLKLDDYRDVVKDEDSFLVNEGNEFFYPRNVIFNKYFNRHDISVITPNKLGDSTVVGNKVTDEDFVGIYEANYNNLPGFKHVDGLNIDVNGDGTIDVNDKVLTTKNGKVILAVRGGTSGESGYQGFHFISVERSAFEDNINNVSLSEYYTTYYPGQSKYPVYTSDDPQYDASSDSKNYKPTYVNYLDQQVKDYKARAEEVEGEIKGFDTNLKYFIYEKLVDEQKIKFNEDLTYVNKEGEEVTIDLNETLMNWISVNRNKADYDTRKAWEDTWRDYVEFLEQQKALRVPGKLLSEVCAKEYELPENQKTTVLWAKGGACYYDK